MDRRTELFLEFMRRNKYSSGLIKEDVIEQVSGNATCRPVSEGKGKKGGSGRPHRTADAGGVGNRAQVEYEDEQKGRKPL